MIDSFVAREDRVLVGALVFALGMHLAMAAVSLAAERPRPRPEPRVMEVALAPRVVETPTPAPEPAEQLVEPPVPVPVPVPAPRPVRAPAPRATPAEPTSEPPPAARAGEVLTAEGPGPREAVRFVSDASGGRFGHGVVAVGGTAEHGLAGARVGGEGIAPTPPAPSPPAAPEITPASELRRPPALRRENPCAGVFPERATADRADVTVRLVVRPDGATTRLSVEDESPAGQGFGALARRCLMRERFVPALDREGEPTPAAARVTIRFVR
ncbi:MAG: energy transducer TonB [Sandaracinus sp.]|nr:energy transducer TonB [Myxococcales bacterium]MCB9599292.1 energy transducer TonB [Sandaracinus sp.]MCB9613882.1 energy transducer TonB [Sandaracinus sp.]MCB9634114.1 energy transducer TonB [Sandaracinus sp.]